ncbi:hypothetical protein DPSP01_008934 [Paraphaeosphaeria sporulosa]
MYLEWPIWIFNACPSFSLQVMSVLGRPEMTRRGRDEAARKRSAWRHFLAKQHARFTLHFLGLPPHGFAVDGNALPPSARFWGSIGHARWVIWALGGEDECQLVQGETPARH